ncbi:methyl-accepting chemotaxis protein [Antribacter sp. KLBMP9083]|uniref:Methyl-accepting chemotaxis protein n=1 Tax=Antribacter soli TaxID=2910976 RepID=A0AA41QJ26_9MICO|nr:methyl-accepting chemotaxis protein [Antribacter soli]MCF4123147.1 methyl-accepting chemotaxis protein [Antribacter soli]
MLLVSVPVMVALAVLLTNSASDSLTAAAEREGQTVAHAVTLRLEDWLSERRESLTVLAETAALAEVARRVADGDPDARFRPEGSKELVVLGESFNAMLDTGRRVAAQVKTAGVEVVRLTTQQQRSATAQVVETMEQLTDASRQVSATAQQIADAAGNLADLAGNLETTAATAAGGSGFR